jgi:hypothetical protein
MPLFVTVHDDDGRRLLSNAPLSHPEEPLAVLVQPGSYRVTVSSGCSGKIAVPALPAGAEAIADVLLVGHKCGVRQE